MKAISDYKNMVMAMVTSGIEIKPALDAAEVVIFGIQGQAFNEPEAATISNGDVPGSFKEVTSKPDVIELEWTGSNKAFQDHFAGVEKELHFTQGQIAAQLGMSTNGFNKTMRANGFLSRSLIDSKKPMPMHSKVTAVSTYRVTGKGSLFGAERIHTRFADGSPAIYRIDWKQSIVSELKKLGVK